MTTWALAAAVYGAVLGFAAITQPIERRTVALVASAAFSLVAVAVGSLGTSFWTNLLVPGALLLTGYWLSGFFFRDPQPWLENWLLRIDRAVSAEQWMGHLPRVVREVLELSYALDYVLVGGGAIYAATFGTAAVADFWTLVLASELASFAPLPWLRSRPPRMIERPRSPGLKPGPSGFSSLSGQGASVQAGPGFSPDNAVSPYLRRLNTAILDHASVQANTIPSGHVSGAVAAALAVGALDPAVGGGMMLMAVVIAVAAIAGRYHYVVDCVTGAMVAGAFWSMA